MSLTRDPRTSWSSSVRDEKKNPWSTDQLFGPWIPESDRPFSCHIDPQDRSGDTWSLNFKLWKGSSKKQEIRTFWVGKSELRKFPYKLKSIDRSWKYFNAVLSNQKFPNFGLNFSTSFFTIRFRTFHFKSFQLSFFTTPLSNSRIRTVKCTYFVTPYLTILATKRGRQHDMYIFTVLILYMYPPVSIQHLHRALFQTFKVLSCGLYSLVHDRV